MKTLLLLCLVFVLDKLFKVVKWAISTFRSRQQMERYWRGYDWSHHRHHRPWGVGLWTFGGTFLLLISLNGWKCNTLVMHSDY